ncbi:MAG TPA: site-specific integrase [Allosphingosinicella sp.]|jgi:integrase
MSVYRPARSRFYHYDFVMKGERYTGSTNLTSKTEARAYEAAVRRRAAIGETAKPPITLSEACGLWSDGKGQYEANWSTSKHHVKTLLRILGGARLLSDLDLADFRKFVARRRAHVTNKGTPLANASINRELEVASRIWRYAAQAHDQAPDGFAVSTIAWGQVTLKEPKERVRELGADEERRLWEHAPNDDLAAVVEFALLSGQRRTSIVTLLWSKVDLIDMRASVRVKGGGWHSFPLTPRLAAIIANRPKTCAQVFTYVCERPAPPRGDRPRRLRGERYPFSKQGWMRKWRKWLKDAEIEDFRFHDLRHTRGTRLLRATGNLKTVQKLLGHTDIATTARYAHAIEEDVRRDMIVAESRNSPEPLRDVKSENPARRKENR